MPECDNWQQGPHPSQRLPAEAVRGESADCQACVCRYPRLGTHPTPPEIHMHLRNVWLRNEWRAWTHPEKLIGVKSSSNLGKDWPWTGPCRAFGHRCVLCLPFLVCREQTPASMTFLSLEGQIQTIANQGREGMQRQGRGSQERIVQPWGRVLLPPQGMYITIASELFRGVVSQFSCSVVSDSLWPHELQHARPPCPSPTPRVRPD